MNKMHQICLSRQKRWRMGHANRNLDVDFENIWSVEKRKGFDKRDGNVWSLSPTCQKVMDSVEQCQHWKCVHCQKLRRKGGCKGVKKGDTKTYRYYLTTNSITFLNAFMHPIPAKQARRFHANKRCLRQSWERLDNAMDPVVCRWVDAQLVMMQDGSDSQTFKGSSGGHCLAMLRVVIDNWGVTWASTER